MRSLTLIALALTLSACDLHDQATEGPWSESRCPAIIPGGFEGEASEPYRIEHFALTGHIHSAGTMDLSTGRHYSLTVEGIGCLSFFAVAYYEGDHETIFATMLGEYAELDNAWSLDLSIEHTNASTPNHEVTLWQIQ